MCFLVIYVRSHPFTLSTIPAIPCLLIKLNDLFMYTKTFNLIGDQGTGHAVNEGDLSAHFI